MKIYDNGQGVSVNAISHEPGNNNDTEGSLYFIHANNHSIDIKFHQGAINNSFMSGFNEQAFIYMLIHRLTVMNTNQPCIENTTAIQQLQQTSVILSMRDAQQKQETHDMTAGEIKLLYTVGNNAAIAINCTYSSNQK